MCIYRIVALRCPVVRGPRFPDRRMSGQRRSRVGTRVSDGNPARAEAAVVRCADDAARWIDGSWRAHGDPSRLQQFPEIVGGHLAIPEDLVTQTGADGFA